MVSLNVASQLSGSDKVVFAGPVTGKDYVYIPKKDKGKVEVEEEDVPELLKLVRESGCGCTKPGMGGQSKRVKFSLFTKE